MKRGWPKKKLGDVILNIKDGGTPSRTRPEYFGGDVYWCVVKDIKPQIFETAEKLTKEGLNNCSAKVWPINSVVISLGATIGQVGIAKVPVATKQGLSGIVVDQRQIMPEFLAYSLQEQKERIQSLATGATIKEIRPSKLKEAISLLVPPLPDQQRIVGVLDEAMSDLATAQTNTEKNLQNAHALFDTHLQSIFTQEGDGWFERRLGDLFDIGSSKRIREHEWTSSGVPFYGGKEIVRLARDGRAVSNNYISEDKFEEYASKYDMPRTGDLLITARGTIGVGYVVREGDKFYYKDGNIISLREKIPTNPNFILYAFRSKTLIQQFDDLTGATVTHLPIERAKALILRMPDFATQSAVVDNLGNFEGQTRRLESVYKQKQVALEALKQSLLHQAFSGNL